MIWRLRRQDLRTMNDVDPARCDGLRNGGNRQIE